MGLFLEYCTVYGNLRFKRKKFAVALFGAIVGIAGIVGQIRTLAFGSGVHAICC